MVEVVDVVGPLADQEGVLDGLRCAAKYANRLVADFVAVAVGAVQEVAAPPLSHAGDVRDLIVEPGGDQDAARERKGLRCRR